MSRYPIAEAVMLANLITPIVRCFPRVARVRPRVRHVAAAPVARRVVRHAARRAARVAMVCTVGALPAAALLTPGPEAPAPAVAPAPASAPAPLPWGIGAAPILPPMTFTPGGGSGGGRGDIFAFNGTPPGNEAPAPGRENTATQVPEPGFLFATGLLALAVVLVAWRRVRARG